MSEINPMARIEPVIYGVLKIQWRDGYVGLVDLRPVIEQGDLFSFLRAAPERFDQARLDEHGHRIVWMDDEGDEIDLGSDSLRKRASRQSELLRLAS